MASASKVVFILGAGPRIGISVAKRFLKDGYKVAIGKRNPQSLQDSELKDMYSVAVDVSQPSSVASAFKEVTENLGIPQLVVYNAALATFPADPTNPFTIAPDAFQQDIAVNATGAYAALYHATSGFLQLKEQDRTVAPAFIATGNLTPFMPKPLFVTLGTGKSALAYLINIANKAYRERGLRFYYVAKTSPQGGPPQVDGPEYAEAFSQIVKGELGGEGWEVRFTVNNEGNIVEISH